MPRQPGPPSFDRPGAELAAGLLKALAHPARVRLVAALLRGPLHVGGLAEQLALPQPIVSQQLKVLRERGLVGASTVAGRALYRVTEPHLARMLGCLSRCVAGRAAGRR